MILRLDSLAIAILGHSEKRFLICFTIVLGLALAPFALIYIYCLRVGETLTVREVVSEQLATNSLYGSALHNPQNRYKIEMVRQVKPKVVAAGNSRSMQFHNKYFLPGSYVNAGGSIQSVEDILAFFEAIKHSQPKVMIIVADWTWFNDNMSNSQILSASEAGAIKAHHVFKVINWIGSGRLDVAHVVNTILRGRNNIGITASTRGSGYNPYGYYDYGASRIEMLEQRTEFSRALEAIERNNGSFVRTESFSFSKLSSFSSAIRTIELAGTTVLVVYPPISDAAHTAAGQISGLNYIYALREKLSALRAIRVDFLFPSSFGSNDCEFVDGSHGGEIAYARILKELAQESAELASWIDPDQINASLEKYSGLSTSDPKWSELERRILEQRNCQ